MNTDTLITELSRDLQPVRRGATRALLRNGLIGGATAAAMVVLFWPTLGARTDLAEAAATSAFWMKLFYTASIAALGFVALERLSQPGVRQPSWFRLLLPPIALLAAVTAVRWAIIPGGQAVSFWMGASWWQCPLYVVLLSAPIFVGVIRAMTHLAPTRLDSAGAAAGLVAGAAGATVYALHCVETSPGFVLLWYSLGLGIATLIGATIGPRLLRW